MRQFNVYKLKNGKTTGAWQLPIKSEMVTKIIDGRAIAKRIQYIKGAGTIFKEDYKGDGKPESIWFDDGEIMASVENFELNEILQKHSRYGKDYELYDEEKTAEKSMGKLLVTTEALNAVLNEKDDDKLRAMAMIILDEAAAQWGPTQCRQKLMEYANKHPEALLYEMGLPNYQSRYLSAIAFNKGIVKYNNTHTAVVWADNDGKIVVVAAGEKGLEKLAETIAIESDQSLVILQRIGEKIDSVSKAGQKAPAAKTEAHILLQFPL